MSQQDCTGLQLFQEEGIWPAALLFNGDVCLISAEKVKGTSRGDEDGGSACLG